MVVGGGCFPVVDNWYDAIGDPTVAVVYKQARWWWAVVVFRLWFLYNHGRQPWQGSLLSSFAGDRCRAFDKGKRWRSRSW